MKILVIIGSFNAARQGYLAAPVLAEFQGGATRPAEPPMFTNYQSAERP